MVEGSPGGVGPNLTVAQRVIVPLIQQLSTNCKIMVPRPHDELSLDKTDTLQ